MAQRVVPSTPAYAGSYVVSTVRPAPGNNVMFEIVADNLQRLYVQMPFDRTDETTIDQTIRAALGALYRPPDPIS